MFEDVPVQPRVKALFERAVQGDAVSHAYLFVGPEGLAKTAFARALAAALVSSCGGCGACDTCGRIARGVHPDVNAVEAEGDLLRTEQIDPIIDDLALKPFTASRRVWIVPEAERLHPAAANRLLKSLEEPPAHVVFLLVSDRPDRVLPTVVSRCQVVEFAPLADGEVRDYLVREQGVQEAVAEALAHLAQGAVERAVRLADDARQAEPRRALYLRHAAALCEGAASGERRPAQAFLAVLEAQTAAVGEQTAEAFEQERSRLEATVDDRRHRAVLVKRAEQRQARLATRLRRLAVTDALDLLASWLRDLLVTACGAPDTIWNSDLRAEVQAAAVAAPEHYRRLLAAVADTRRTVSLNVDHKLALQAMLARFEEVSYRATSRERGLQERR